MISIDTNLLVRFLTNDDKEQANYVAKLIEENVIFIPKTVLLKTEWILRYSYNLTSTNILNAFLKLLGLPQVTVEDISCVTQALKWYEQKLDFADALHLASSHSAKKFVTFDKAFIRKAKKLGIKLLFE